MALVDLNIADDDAMSYAEPHAVSQAPCIYLTAAQVKALGITTPPRAGTKMALRGSVFVEKTVESIDGDMDDPDIALTLCLEYAELGQTEVSSEAGDVLYGQ